MVDTDYALPFVDEAIKQFPNDSTLYNLKTKYIYGNIIDTVQTVDSDVFKELEQCIAMSLKLFDCPTNEAWVNLCKYYSLYYFNDLERKSKMIKEVFEKYSILKTPILAQAYKSFYKNVGIDAKGCIDKLNELLSYADKADDWVFYEEVVSALLSVYEDQGDKKAMLQLLSEYEAVYKPSDSFLYMKAKYLENVLDKYKEAKELIKNNIQKSRRWKILMLQYYCDVRDKDNAKKILDKYFGKDLKCQLSFHSTFNDDEEVVRIVDLYAQNHSLDVQQISSKSCSLIRMGQYEKAYFFMKQYYEQTYMQREGVICINYYLALEKYKKPNDFEAKIKSKMIDGHMNYTPAEMAAAYALLNDKAKCFSTLKKVVEKQELMKFDIKEWPVFEKYHNDPKFKEITDTNNIDL